MLHQRARHAGILVSIVLVVVALAVAWWFAG